MKSYLVTVCLILLFAGMALSCRMEKDALFRRIENSRKCLQQNLLTPNSNWVWKTGAQLYLAAVERIDGNDLAKPLLAGALGRRTPKNDLFLAVFWIADEPTVDAVEFQSKNRNASVRCEIQEEYRKENAEAGKETVLYRVTYLWPSNKIPAALEGDDAEVFLVRRGEAISAGHSIVFEPVGVMAQRLSDADKSGNSGQK